MAHIKLLILFLISILILFACSDKKDLIISPINLLTENYNNIPVIVNTENSYTFTVNANNFSYSTNDNLNFSSDSLVITLTLVNVTSSNGSMKVFNESNEEIFSELLDRNKVIVKTDFINQKPEQIKVELINFTGQLTAVIATKIP